MVEEINNSYLQYTYLIFDSEYFKSGYIISPQNNNFSETIKKILKESSDEILQI